MSGYDFIKAFTKINIKEASLYVGVSYPNVSAGKISKEKQEKIVNYIVTNFISIYNQYLISKEINDDE